MLDTQGIIKSWDGGATRLLQHTAKEAIGQHASMFFIAQDVAKGIDTQEMALALLHGEAEDERWHVRKDGSTFWGSGIMAPLYDGQEHIGFGKIFRDRTWHTQHEQRKDDFVAIAGHELRNPLSVLKSNVELLLHMPPANSAPELNEIYQGMNERVDRLTHLVNDLLDLSKIASGQLIPKKQPIQLKTVVKDVANEYHSMHTSHSIVLLSGEDVEVLADKDQIIQVLNNLITNAIKYSPKEEPIEISLKTELGQACVSIKDYGVGITEEDKNKIFERFYRIDTTSQTAEGLGIGLYVCMEIIKAHGGTIGVEKNKGKGSTFYFMLPLQSN